MENFRSYFSMSAAYVCWVAEIEYVAILYYYTV